MKYCYKLLITLLGLGALATQAQTLDGYLQRTAHSARMDSLLFIFQQKVLLQDSITAKQSIAAMEKIQHNTLPINKIGRYFRGYYYGGGLQKNIRISLPYYQQNIVELQNASDVFAQNLLAVNLQAAGTHLLMNEKGMESQALTYFLKSDSVFKVIGYENAFGSFQALASIGDFYLRVKEYPLALDYLKRAGLYIERESWTWPKINYYNNLGLCLGYLKMYSESVETFQKIIPYVSTHQDSVWIGIANGNIASQYLAMGRLDDAEKYLLIDYSYSVQYKEYCGVVETLGLLAKINIQQKRLPKAKKYIDEAEIWLKNCDAPPSKHHHLERKYEYYAQLEDYKNALFYKLASLKIRDSLNRAKQEQQIEAKTLAFEAQREKNELKLVAQEHEYTTLERNFLLFGLLAVAISGFFVIRAMRFKAQKQKTLMQLQQAEFRQEMQESILKLQAFTDKIRQKNQLIEQIQKEVEALQSGQQHTEKEVFLEKLGQSTIITQQDWVQFSQVFERVYPHFLKNLQTDYPQLTHTDIRLLVLTKLQFSSKEMAAMLGVSVDAIHKSRYRLRKKLNLPEEDNFSQLISQVSGTNKK